MSQSSIVANGNYAGGIVGTLKGELNGIIVDNTVTVDANGKQIVGGLVGRTNNTTANKKAQIINCTFGGTLLSSNANNGYGGILGTADGGTVEIVDCTMSGTIESTGYTGGIIGLIRKAGTTTIRNCQVTETATVTGISDETKYQKLTGSVIGGITGTDTTTNNNETVYNTVVYLEDVYTASEARVPGEEEGKYVVAPNENTGLIGVGTNNSKAIVYGVVTRIPTGGITDQIPRMDWYTVSSRKMVGTTVTYEHQNGAEFEISSVRDMYGLAELVNEYGVTFANSTIKLTQSIEFNSSWNAIGTSENVFAGIFDGQSNTISKLYIDKASADEQGLFGFASGIIQNLNISDSFIQGRHRIGTIVGTLYGGQLINVHVKNSVEVKVQLQAHKLLAVW